ncbi:hypothetical protein HYU96_04750 [Candidatus Daviesbacteria bacterium]|nr:hypothetical protein [Candidatus Daviesbacteria bacterium]
MFRNIETGAAAAIAMLTIGCGKVEPPVATLPLVASPTTEATAVSPIPTLEPPPATSTPQPPEPTPTPAPQIKIPGEQGRTYLSDLRLKDTGRNTGNFLLTSAPDGLIVGFSTTRLCNGQSSRESGAFFADKGLTERSVKFQRPNAILDAVMPAGDNRFFGNFSLLAGGGCNEQDFSLLAVPTELLGQAGIEATSLQILRAIELRPGSPREAFEILMRPCRQCLAQKLDPAK